MFASAQNNIVHSSRALEAACMSVTRILNKETVVHSYRTIVRMVYKHVGHIVLFFDLAFPFSVKLLRFIMWNEKHNVVEWKSKIECCIKVTLLKVGFIHLWEDYSK